MFERELGLNQKGELNFNKSFLHLNAKMQRLL